ncbi:MAG: hypothetical protein CM1200mP2_45230 [Planctomycetaceae bacterium]|nr:MAG: hypothetical protein CM1200mP2_45230 [Planctomycetaceae bacterium]
MTGFSETPPGVNGLVAWVDWNRPSRLQVRFRTGRSRGARDLAQRALKEKGDAVLGKRIFRDIKRRGLWPAATGSENPVHGSARP